MNETPADLWIDALRSGKYDQTTGHLSNAHGHCCLGVACLVAADNGLDVNIRSIPSGVISYDGETTHLPPRVQEWLGLASSNGDFEDEDRYGANLADLNDAGESFAEIALVIESRPDGLFR